MFWKMGSKSLVKHESAKSFLAFIIIFLSEEMKSKRETDQYLSDCYVPKLSNEQI